MMSNTLTCGFCVGRACGPESGQRLSMYSVVRYLDLTWHMRATHLPSPDHIAVGVELDGSEVT